MKEIKCRGLPSLYGHCHEPGVKTTTDCCPVCFPRTAEAQETYLEKINQIVKLIPFNNNKAGNQEHSQEYIVAQEKMGNAMLEFYKWGHGEPMKNPSPSHCDVCNVMCRQKDSITINRMVDDWNGWFIARYPFATELENTNEWIKICPRCAPKAIMAIREVEAPRSTGHTMKTGYKYR